MSAVLAADLPRVPTSVGFSVGRSGEWSVGGTRSTGESTGPWAKSATDSACLAEPRPRFAEGSSSRAVVLEEEDGRLANWRSAIRAIAGGEEVSRRGLLAARSVAPWGSRCPSARLSSTEDEGRWVSSELGVSPPERMMVGSNCQPATTPIRRAKAVPAINGRMPKRRVFSPERIDDPPHSRSLIPW